MKVKLLGIISILLLTSCVNNTAQEQSNLMEKVLGQVPTSCELSGVNAAFAKIIPPSKYIPTDWQPAEGTDLKAALDAGGIACTYGDQDAEVGGTLIWAPSSAWTEREAQWISDGMLKVDIPNIEESAAYKFPEGATSADGMPAWKVNLLINGVWIQLGAAFIQSWNEATPIIQAAIEATK